MAPSAPGVLFVVRGRSRAWLALPLVAIAGTPLYALGLYLAVTAASNAGLYSVYPSAGPAVAFLASAVLIAVPGMLGTIRLLRTTGSTTLTLAGLTWRNDFMPVHVPWHDVMAYRDDHASYIEVVARRTRSTTGSRTHYLPTLDERDRVAVLQVLDALGLRRAGLDGS